MQNKSKFHSDVQWVISSVSLAATLGLWGLFASADRKGAGVSGQVTLVQPPDPQPVVVTQPMQSQTLLPGQVLLFGGTAPQPQQSQTVITTASGSTTVTRRSGGGGGSSGGASKPPAHTGSSRP